MHVAADHDRVGDFLLVDKTQELLSCAGVAIPAVGPELPPGTGFAVELRHKGLLREDVPARLRAGHRALEPRFLLAAEKAARRIDDVLAHVRIDNGGATLLRGADLMGAVLAVIDDIEAGEAAPRQPPVEAQRRTPRAPGGGARHVGPK